MINFSFNLFIHKMYLHEKINRYLLNVSYNISVSPLTLSLAIVASDEREEAGGSGDAECESEVNNEQ